MMYVRNKRGKPAMMSSTKVEITAAYSSRALACIFICVFYKERDYLCVTHLLYHQ